MSSSAGARIQALNNDDIANADEVKAIASRLRHLLARVETLEKVPGGKPPPAPAPAPAADAVPAGATCVPVDNKGSAFKYELPSCLQWQDPLIANKHPPWVMPKNGTDLGLKVNNSLTGPDGKVKSEDLVRFIPASGKKVNWYTCGPTVYDACHMGHARAYLTFDILRRIVEDYFGYEVMYHINITDIDDKIILRARRNYLLDLYQKELVAKGDAGLVSLGGDATASVAKKITKLASKRAEIEAELATECAAMRKEALETKLGENTLKTGQAFLSQKKLALLDGTFAGGLDKASATLLGDAAATCGAKKPAANLGAGVLALQGFIANCDTSVPEQQAAQKAAKTHLELVQFLEAWGAASGLTGKIDAYIAAARDELGEMVDAAKGDSVTDHDIFNSHARRFEREYMEDMAALGVKEPDVLTRVTEHVPDIVDFVQKIVSKGLAYASNGSVYLDIEAFRKAGHHYRKLKPGTVTSKEDMAESEGDLGGGASEKKHENDFALWKASKPGEPEWESPWGMGRPGWHIECSAIAGNVLGEHLDVHAGGVDLKFPHHDNELAQSEACFGHHQWVSYFFHAGHLHIEGLKMSKSLKNFITIRQALNSEIEGANMQTTARHIRLTFLLKAWDRAMSYSDAGVKAAQLHERFLIRFFNDTRQYIARDWLGSGHRIGVKPIDTEMYAKLAEVRAKVHACLCNNFDTEGALTAMMDSLVKYVLPLLDEEDPAKQPGYLAVKKVSIFVTKIYKVLGVIEGQEDIGFAVKAEAKWIDALNEFRDSVRLISRNKAAPDAYLKLGEEVKAKMAAMGVTVTDGAAASAPKWANGSTESQFIAALVAFRDKVREAALGGAPNKDYLGFCDELRDDVFIGLGVQIEDSSTDGKASRWFAGFNPASLRAAAAAKVAEGKQKAVEKLKRKLAKANDDLAKNKDIALPPKDLFQKDKDKYSAFDERGVPTKMADGSDVPKSNAKKLDKAYSKAEKAHAKLVKQAKGDLDAYFAGLQASIDALAAEIASAEA